MPTPTALLSLPSPTVQAARTAAKSSAPDRTELTPRESTFQTTLRDTARPAETAAVPPETRLSATSHDEPTSAETHDSIEPGPPGAPPDPELADPKESTEPPAVEVRSPTDPEPASKPNETAPEATEPAQEVLIDPIASEPVIPESGVPGAAVSVAEINQPIAPAKPDAPVEPTAPVQSPPPAVAVAPTGAGEAGSELQPPIPTSESVAPTPRSGAGESNPEPVVQLTERPESVNPNRVEPPPVQSGARNPTPNEGRSTHESQVRTSATPAPEVAPRGEARQEQTGAREEQPQHPKTPLPSRDAGEKTAPAVARATQVEQTVRLQAAESASPGGDGSTSASTPIHQAVKLELVTPAPKTVAAPNAAGPAIENEQFAGRVVKSLTAMVNQRGGVMHMRLDPPDLGQLRIRMTIMRGVVSAEFHANTQQAQSMLDRSLAVLRTSLESQGLTVERLTVHTSSQGQQTMTQQGERQDQSPTRQHADAGDGRSRGRGDAESRHPDGRSGHSRTRFAERFSRLVTSLSGQPA